MSNLLWYSPQCTQGNCKCSALATSYVKVTLCLDKNFRIERKRREEGREGNDKKSIYFLFKRERKGEEEKIIFLSNLSTFWRDLIISIIKGTNPFTLTSYPSSLNLLFKQRKLYPLNPSFFFFSTQFSQSKQSVTVKRKIDFRREVSSMNRIFHSTACLATWNSFSNAELNWPKYYFWQIKIFEMWNEVDSIPMTMSIGTNIKIWKF